MSGVSFGASQDTTPTSRLGLSDCGTAAWVSVTSVACFLTRGDGVGHVATMTAVGVVGTRTSTFSYDGLPLFDPTVGMSTDCLSSKAPVASFLLELNSASTSGYSVTVSGMNFAVSATTPTSTIGLSSCATASWASATSLVCMLSMGEGVIHVLRVTVAGVVGSRTAIFSYDGGRLLDVRGNNSNGHDLYGFHQHRL